ncbi:MAG: hypothetical protein EOP09_08560 [Proteobacteria bacterium]|nr:MAG: hypothetical protein EOP09_08560 [Pseudomonadota bacterium]
MKRKRYTEEQIIAILKEGESGIPTPDLCRRHGISEGVDSQYFSRISVDNLQIVSHSIPRRSGINLRSNCRERNSVDKNT